MQQLDAPDGPGWWAFEGGQVYNGERFNEFQRVFEVVLTGRGLYVFGGGLNHAVAETNLIGKWTRLHMPWESAPAAQPAMPLALSKAIRWMVNNDTDFQRYDMPQEYVDAIVKYANEAN